MKTVYDLPSVSADCRADLAGLIHGMPASRLIGLKVLGFDAAGVSLIELPLEPELSFDGAAAQGGIVGMLADYAGVSAAACTLAAGWIASTTGYEVHNVAPARGRRLLAVGRAVHVGKSTAVSRAEVYAQGEGDALTLVCLATTTCKPMDLSGASSGAAR
jgi:uncharacterized protein (TIGR00369 family)